MTAPLAEIAARKLAPEITGFEYDMLLDDQKAAIRSRVQPVLDACGAEEIHHLLAAIANYPDANVISDAHYVVRQQAKDLLVKLDGKPTEAA